MVELFKQFPLAFFVAFRMARSKRSPTLSVVTLLSIGGVAIGVLSLTVVLGVTGGFQQAFQDRILGLYPHLVVHRGNSEIQNYQELVQEISEVEGVVAASPVTFDDMMMAAGVHRAGAVVKGIELSSANDVIGIEALLKNGGTLSSLDETLSIKRAGDDITIGKPIADTWNTLLVHPGGIAWWVEDRTPPRAGLSRLSIIDARADGVSNDIQLTWTDGFDEPLKKNATLRASLPQERAALIDVGPGTWRIEPAQRMVELDADEFVTLVLMDSETEGQTDVMSIRSPRRAPLAEEQAMVRLLNADRSSGSLGLRGVGGTHFEAIGPGAHTGFEPVEARLPGLLMGVALAERLEAKVGDAISLVTPLRGVDNKMVGPYGMLPSSARHVVTGIFDSGFHDYDVRLAFVALSAAQRFLNRGDTIRWIEIKTDDLFDLGATKERVRAAVDPYDYETLVSASQLLKKHASDLRDVRLGPVQEGGTGFGDAIAEDLRRLTMLRFQEFNIGYHPEFRLLDWEQLNQNLFNALKLQKVVLAMFFLIIIVVGCFVVVGSQVMVIHDKTADIAILKTMGAKRIEVGLVFAIQGMMVALTGIVLGLLGGLGICWAIHAFDYRLDSAIYLIDRLPIKVEPGELAAVAVVTLACTFFAVVYSAWRASQKMPVDGLRTLD